jgi:hypothetical protein
MSRHSLLVLISLLGSLAAPVNAYAQLTPPAGSAGAGSTAINGIPFGPANPSVVSDPSGIGNAAKIPPLRTNSPAPPVVYNGAAVSSPSPQPRVATPSVGASQRIVSADRDDSGRPPGRRHGHPYVSHFTGICRGC